MPCLTRGCGNGLTAGIGLMSGLKPPDLAQAVHRLGFILTLHDAKGLVLRGDYLEESLTPPRIMATSDNMHAKTSNE